MNIKQTKQAIRAYLAADIPVMIWGAPGIGKSQAMQQVARDEYGGRMLTYRLNLLESVDLRGLPHVTADGVQWAVPDMIAELRQFPADLPCVLFLDEVNTATPAVMAAAMQLVLDRQIGPHKLPGNVKITAAGNRQKDRASANRTPTALNNRFAHIEAEPDAGELKEYGEANNWSPLAIAFLAFRPNLIHVMPQDDSPAFPTPRSWESASKMIDAPEATRPQLIRGLVGQAAASEFEYFLQAWRHVPRLADILADPEGTPVPDASQPALLYAVAVQVAGAATRQNIDTLARYIGRLPKEHQVVVMVDATKRDKSLMETAAFVAWCAANSDVQT